MELGDVQAEILQQVLPLVRPGGVLAYATCSMLREENSDKIHDFIGKNAGLTLTFKRQWMSDEGTDGFYCAHLLRS